MSGGAAKRVDQVVKLVDRLELDSEEIGLLRDTLARREECELDLSACKDDDERALAVSIKDRIDELEHGTGGLVSAGGGSGAFGTN